MQDYQGEERHQPRHAQSEIDRTLECIHEYVPSLADVVAEAVRSHPDLLDALREATDSAALALVQDDVDPVASGGGRTSTLNFARRSMVRLSRSLVVSDLERCVRAELARRGIPYPVSASRLGWLRQEGA